MLGLVSVKIQYVMYVFFFMLYFYGGDKLKQAKDFLILIYSDLRKSTYHVISIIFLLIANLSMYGYLKQRERLLEIIILEDLQRAFIKYIKEEITWELINIVANKHSSNLNGSSAIYKMNVNLDRVFSDYIYYEVKANNIVLASNIYSGREPLLLVYEYTLDKTSAAL